MDYIERKEGIKIMNKSILLGRLTKDPEVRYSQENNNMIATFTLAVNRKYVRQGEERQTDFINIVAYLKLAEFANKYLHQGNQVCVSGRIQTRNYEDKNGQKRYVTEIIAEELDFADSLKKEQPDVNVLCANSTANENLSKNENTGTTEEFIADPDDLPF